MPLKIRMRPGERVIINGVVLRNRGPRAAELDVLNHGIILHERDIMLAEQNISPFHQLYLLLQAMQLEEGDRELVQRQAIVTTSQIVVAAMKEGDQSTLELGAEIVTLIGNRNYLMAMRRLQKVIGRPGDLRNEHRKEDEETEEQDS